VKDSLTQKLESLLDRKTEIEALLSSPEVLDNQKQYRELSKEHSDVTPIVACYEEYKNANHQLLTATELSKESDLEIRDLANEEISDSKFLIDKLEKQIQQLLIPKDPKDDANVFLEIRAGTGGDEAAIFVGNLMRMYLRFSDGKKWQTEIVSSSESEVGGFKEVILLIKGKGAYSKLKFESGAHRVQRVPETESQGRIHTSACTVAVMPEVTEAEEVEINPSEIRVDTFRASGAGGQHVNKTDSAIRITHLATNMVVECQDERSQHKNKARAMTILKSKLLQAEQDRIETEQASTRKKLVGSGDRSERIRTYNYPQGRVTDHRINLTLYKLDDILVGDLDLLVGPLMTEHQAELVAQSQAD